MKLEIKKGKDLPRSYIKKWNKIRIDDWSKNKPIKNYKDSIFFTLYSKEGEVLSSGRLKPIKVKFNGKSYEILGSGDLISTIKGKGYGKKIKKAQIKYVKSKKKTMIGFCARRNFKFYEKCGLKMEKNVSKKFLLLMPKDFQPHDPDINYINGKDNFIKKFLS